MKLRPGTAGFAALSLAALAGLLTAPAWAPEQSAPSDPLVQEATGEAPTEVEPIEEPSAGEFEGSAPRQKEPSAGEAEGPAHRQKGPSGGETEALATHEGLLDAEALEALVAPVALYPDDLLAVVLPASTYPLQVVLAARFLEAGQESANGEAMLPSKEWDNAVVALLNYPEVVALMDGNLEWTRRLGEAVLAQEEDVIAAIGAFRQQAREAGNLESDGKQEVAVTENGAIEIKPAVPDEIYVPYYEPAEVVERQTVQVYHYYSRPYPVYYYPYHQGHDFAYGPFWGVTSAFSIGWRTRNLHLHHYGYLDHPYNSYHYHDPFYHRRPHVVLNVYDRDRRHRHRHRSDRHHRGNDWRSERSQRDHRRWAQRGEGRRSEGRRGERRREFARNDGRRGESARNDRRRQANRGNGPRGEGRGDHQRRGDRQRRTERERGQSIAGSFTLRPGVNQVVHRPTRITRSSEGRPRPIPNRTGSSGAVAANAASPSPSPAQRPERQRAPRWRAERRSENARLPRSRSRAEEPVAIRPTQRPNRAQPAHRTQRPARQSRPAAARPSRAANTPNRSWQAQRAERQARERIPRRAPARATQPSRSIDLQRRVNAPRLQADLRTRINPASPPRAQRPQAANRHAGRQARSPASVDREAATRHTAPRTRMEPRVNRQASARVDRDTTRARPRSGPSRNDLPSRRPR